MLIKYLEVHDFNKIDEIKISFPFKNASHSVIFIGENGSGKSTVFEAILTIFGSYKSPALINNPFSYEVEYIYKNRNIYLDVNHDKYEPKYFLEIKEWEETICVISSETFEKFRSKIGSLSFSIFPNKILTSYSGYNDRLYEIYKKITASYKRGLSEKFNKINYSKSFKTNIIQGENYNFDNNLYPEKQFIHSLNKNILFYLPVIWSAEGSIEKNIIKKYCKIEDIVSVAINIKLTKDNLKKLSVEKSEEIADLLEESRVASLIKEKKSNKSNTLVIKFDNKTLLTIDIFNILEKYRSIFNAEIELTLKKNGHNISAYNLSEGEMQLIKVVGMLFITKNIDGIVMIDEPDSHLSPKWKYKLNEIISDILKDSKNTQVIITTHDPLLINGSLAEEVRIIKRINNTIVSHKPRTNAIGKGIDSILQSDYFNLETTLDRSTKNKVIRKQELFGKRQNNSMDEEEKEEFINLRDELSRMDYTTNIPTDKFYAEYRSILNELRIDKTTTLKDSKKQEDRRNKIVSIIEELLDK